VKTVVSRFLFGIRVSHALAFLGLAAAPAAAQVSRVTGPFAGLFGGDAKAEQALDLRGSLFGAYDFGGSQPPLAPPGSASGSDLSQPGGAAGADGTVSYRRRWRRGQFSASGQGGFQQYPGGSVGGADYSATTAFTTNLTRKVVLGGNADYARSPFYDLAPLTGPNTIESIPLTPGYDVTAAALPTTSLGAGLSLVGNFSKSSTVTGDIHWAQTRFHGPQANDNFGDLGADLAFSHRITRSLGFHVGYGQDRIKDGSLNSSPATRTIDVGVDYARAFSFSGKKTTLTFSTLSTVVHFEGETDFDLGGSAALTRPLARTWNLQVGYFRRAGFVPGFGKPVVSDAVNTSVDGLLAPGLHWLASGGFSHDGIGFNGSESFTVYTVSSTLDLALTRALGLFVQYGYYRYRVPPGSTDLPLALLFSRHSATVGLTAWLPLIHSRSRA
jgi:hypothetical protein